MRILSGKLKGSKIQTNNEKFEGSGNFVTRPTSDRVKETLFNIIQHGFNVDFSKISFLDCFSGSGAVGLEAISRGCSIVSFLEKNSTACECITKNLTNFKLYENDQSNTFRILNYDFFDSKLFSKPNFDAVYSRSIGTEVPAKAAAPKGQIFTLFRTSARRSLSLSNISI